MEKHVFFKSTLKSFRNSCCLHIFILLCKFNAAFIINNTKTYSTTFGFLMVGWQKSPFSCILNIEYQYFLYWTFLYLNSINFSHSDNVLLEQDVNCKHFDIRISCKFWAADRGRGYKLLHNIFTNKMHQTLQNYDILGVYLHCNMRSVEDGVLRCSNTHLYWFPDTFLYSFVEFRIIISFETDKYIDPARTFLCASPFIVDTSKNSLFYNDKKPVRK